MLIFQTHGQRHRLFLPWTLFTVSVRYRDGILADLDVREMQQENPGNPHPYAASVRILSTRFEKDNGSLPADFNGYSAFTVPNQEFDGATNLWGRTVGREYITLDEESFPGAAIPIAELSAPLPDVDPFVQRNP
jgi:hypothetical protein